MKPIVAALLLIATTADPARAQRGPDPAAIIDAATTAMGTGRVMSVRYTGTAGAIFPTGQAYRTGGPWPRFSLKRYTMAINYTVPAMRQEVVRVDDERPTRGGGAGGYNPATYQGGIRPIPGDIVQNQLTDGRTEAGAVSVWLTPHGFLKGAAAHLAGARATGARGSRMVSFQAGKYTVTGTINARNLVEHVEALIDVPYTGDTRIEGTYTDYRDSGGVQFPMHIIMREGGFPTLDVTVATVELNSADAMRVGAPDTTAAGEAAGRGAPTAAPRPTPPPERIAEGVWVLTPGLEGSLLVEFKDYVVLIEAPASEAYTTNALALARQIAPAKPIRYVVNTHHHADHASGMRAYVAEGIPIITHASHEQYYRTVVFKNPHALNPDHLARSPRAPVIETMTDRRIISDGEMSVELHLMRGQPHAEGLLMVYLPRAKLLVQADAFIPRPGAPPLPAPSPYTINLVDNVTRLHLDVDRVVHIHGGSSPYSDVRAAARR